VTNYGDNQYYGDIYIGTPAQHFTALFDTGSTAIYIPQKGCTECPTVSDEFDPTASSTYTTQSVSYNIQYGQGEVAGIIGYDTIGIGDDDSISATQQPFLLVSSEEDNDGMKPDGLIGFGFAGLDDGMPSLMDTLKAQGKIDKRQFAIFLNTDGSYENGDKSPSSNLMIDGYDLGKYSTESSFNYVDVTDSGYWSVIADTITLGDQTLAVEYYVIIDTGTSWIFGPDDQATTFQNTLLGRTDCQLGEDELQCTCTPTDSAGAYPIITFSMGGQDYTLAAKDYFQPLDDAGLNCQVIISGSDDPFWLLGDAFIRNYYINFDMDGMRIGFAEARGLCLAFNLVGIFLFSLMV